MLKCIIYILNILRALLFFYLEEKERLYCETDHSFVPDDAHPLLDAIGPLWDEGEVVLSNSFLCRGEGAVSAGCQLKIPTETVHDGQ